MFGFVPIGKRNFYQGAAKTPQRQMKKHGDSIFQNLKNKKKLKNNLGKTEIMICHNHETSKVEILIYIDVMYAKRDAYLETLAFATPSNNVEYEAPAIWGPMKAVLQHILKAI